MIHFIPIKNEQQLHFPDFFAIYQEAFPPAERRTRKGLINELLAENFFRPNVLIKDDDVVGILNYWIFPKFVYIEHFAIRQFFRAKGYGTQALTLFKEQMKLPILFEVEMPDDLLAVKRIRFYEQLGFTVVPKPYAQPAYNDNGFFIPMLLMTNNSLFANTHFELVKHTLYNEVYKHEHNVSKPIYKG